MYPSTIVSQILAYHFLITTTVFPVFILKNSNFYSLSYPMWTTINCFTNLLLFLTLLCIYFPLYQVNICGQITKIVPLYVFPSTLPSLPSLYSTLYLPGKTLTPNNCMYHLLPHGFKALHRTQYLIEAYPGHSASPSHHQIWYSWFSSPIMFFPSLLWSNIFINLLIY